MLNAAKVDAIKEMSTDVLIPYGANARTHSVDQVSQIAASMREFGFNNPILIDERNGIIAGHGRLEAARLLGMETVPTITLAHLSEAQKKAYILADNKLALNAGWDMDMLQAELEGLQDLDFDLSLNGFDDGELADLLDKTDGLTDPDAIPENVTPTAQTGDVWRLWRHTLVCGDSTDVDVVSVVMDGKLADCVFTSPPYGVGVDYGDVGYTDTIDALREMLPKLAEIWTGFVVPGGFAVTNFGDLVSGAEASRSEELTEYPMAMEYWPAFTGAGWSLWTRRVWCNQVGGAGSMQCISSNRAATNWEHVWTWRKPGSRMFTKQITGKYPSQNGWFDTSDDHAFQPHLKGHGAGMPVTVAERGIYWHSLPNGCVLEPFSGTGTTIIAAEMSGRACHAIELNPEYVDIAVKRWEAFTGREAIHEQRIQTDDRAAQAG